MKLNFLLMLAFVFAGFMANAQTEKGNFLVGGQASLSLGSVDYFNSSLEEKTGVLFDLGLYPTVGFFVADRFSIGGRITGALNKFPEQDINGNLTVGPFVRYYLKNNIFGQADVGVGFQDGINLNVGLGAGYAHFINNNIAIEPIATVAFNDGVRVNILAGFQLYFSRGELKDFVPGK